MANSSIGRSATTPAPPPQGSKAWYEEAEKEIGVAADVADQTYLGLTFDKPYPMPAIPLSLVDTTIGDGINGLTLTASS
jgi:hypothetical protein